MKAKIVTKGGRLAPGAGVTETYTIQFSSQELMDRFDKLLGLMEWCGRIRHSCHCSMFMDGDGSDAILANVTSVDGSDARHVDAESM